MRGIRIPYDIDLPIEEVEVGPYPGINDALSVHTIPGRRVWIERVKTPELHSLAQVDYDPETRRGGSPFPSVDMWVDEEGLVKRLPWNVRASVFYPLGVIAGDAILLGEEESEPDEDGIREPEAASLVDSITVERIETICQAAGVPVVG